MFIYIFWYDADLKKKKKVHINTAEPPWDQR